MFHKRFIFMLLLLTALGAVLPAGAQDNTYTVTFEDTTLEYSRAMGDSVAIVRYPGDPAEGAAPGFSDAAHLQFNMYSTYASPDGSTGTGGGIRVYRLSDLEAYGFMVAEADALRALLAERPDISQGDSPVTSGMDNALPFLPVLPHGQIIHAHAEYIENAQIEGIGYITYSNADMSPFLSNTFSYTFQGLSRDGQFYVTAGFPLLTPLFPAEGPADFNMESFQAEWPQYVAESIATLDNASPEDFTPSLSAIRGVIDGLVTSG